MLWGHADENQTLLLLYNFVQPELTHTNHILLYIFQVTGITMTLMSPNLVTYMLEEGYDKYKKIRHLFDEEGKCDPENDPFRSAYKARELLQELSNKVHVERECDDAHVGLRVIEASLRYQLGLNYIFCEERPCGEEYLQKSVSLLKDEINTANSKDAVSIVMAAQTELGILWASRYQGAQQALSILEKVEYSYHEYKRISDHAPLTIDESLHPPEEHLTENERREKFENIYTHALFYLAQVHKHLGNNDLAATYCQRTLRRQLKIGNYDRKEWAVNAAGLSQYFITRNMFVQAKHCLCCANVVIEECKTTASDVEAAVFQRKADIARCWVKYFLALMEYSKEKLYDDVLELDRDRQTNAQIAGDEEDEVKNPYRMPMELGVEEENTRHQPIVTFEEARQVFLQCRSHVDFALKFFVMDGYVTDNIELAQDMSALYKHLLFFETAKDRKCKMHKRRADLITGVLEEINPQFYLLVCRQLQFELGEIHSDMVDLKVEIVNASNGPAGPHAVKKINSLCLSSIKYFREFLDTLKNPNGEFPESLDGDVERPAVVAHFYLARLHSKVLASEQQDKLDWKRRSLQFYQWIVDYVQRNPKCTASVQKEFEICQEMVVLLPKSLDRQL